MPKLYISNSRGRQQILAGNRAPRLKEQKDGTYQEKPNRKRKSGAKYGATTPSKARRTQPVARNVIDDESTTSGDEGDAEDDEDDAEPNVSAPPRALTSHEAGRYQYDRSDDNLSEAGETDSMFGDSYDPEKEEALHNRLVDDDNDEFYQAVDDISDSDIDDDKILEEQAKIVLEDVHSDGLRDDSEDPSFYLNQIEGMSAYGFGDDSDGTVPFYGSSQSSDSANETLTRHVRFEETFPEERAFRGLSESPTMTRALLPSAMPTTLMQSLTGESGVEDYEPSEEPDSDLTDDDLPAAALDAPMYEEHLHDDLPDPDSLPKKLRPPPSGRFIDDGVQSAGILDSTGTMLLITNPQSLGEEFARRYGASAPPSPSMDFAEVVLGNIDSPEMSNALVPDPMFSGLNSRANATASGQTISIPEAFFAPDLQVPNPFGQLAEPFDDGEASGFSDLDEGEHLMRIEDIVSFDTDSDDDSPTSPAVGYDAFSSPGLSHLSTGNLMAFRRNADPTMRAMHSSPITGHAAARAARLNNSQKSRQRKRKARIDSPYNDAYYKGVTPVQRVSHPDNDLSMPSSSPTKRQRMI